MNKKKPTSSRPKKKRVYLRSKRVKWIGIAIAAAVALIVIAGLWLYSEAFSRFQADASVTVIIPPGSDDDDIRDSLSVRLGDYGNSVYRLWSLRGGDAAKAPGVYTVAAGDRAWSIASRLKAGRSSTVTVTFNNIRKMEDLADRIAKSFPWSSKEFMFACDSVLELKGITRAMQPAFFVPDTYEFYASATPSDVVEKLVEYRDNFWTEERTGQARRLGLTPSEVAIIASIAEEESANRDERAVIGRLYINRLQRGMKLQADPTVKYSLGDFSLRRLYEKHLLNPSPYNTYRVNGLPPGPIRIPEKATLTAILNSEPHDYIYMCAKPDNSGTHNFSSDYEKHKRYAAQYRNWLDERNIH